METKLILEGADEKLDNILRRRAQLASGLAQLGCELADAEAHLGEAILAGDESILPQIAEMRLRVDGINAALAALDKREEAAKLDRRRAEMFDLRDRANNRRAQLEELEQKTSKHLRALSDLEEIAYDRCILAAQRTAGDWHAAINAATPEVGYLPPSDVFRYSVPTDPPYFLPLSTKLHIEILGLEAKAAEIDHELNPAPEEVPVPVPEPVRPPDSEYGGRSWYRP